LNRLSARNCLRDFLLEHGFLDAVVPRSELKGYLVRALDFLGNPAVVK
jgi:acetyl-CoA carboxylase carboxyl transferase subunit beta